MSRWGYYEYFPPSRPRAAKSGIKAQSKRGTFGRSWWAKRWIRVLEGFYIGARLGRGRSYARSGQVLSIDIDKGTATAQVQGSRPKPYEVTITVKSLTVTDWKKLAVELSRQAIFAAKLLAGEMPQEIEQVFTDAGLSLFPEKAKDLKTDCSCPDWSNPCKHIAAVYYLLGEEFDRDPFLLFTLRGMSREEFVGLLGGASGETTMRKTGSQAGTPEAGADASLQPEPLTTEVPGFWDGDGLADDLFGEVRLPPVPAALPKRLGGFPFWRGTARFLEAIEPIYVQAAPFGMSMFLGEREAMTDDDTP
ncbi:MAG: SWIM zinc finger family protein [Terriglobia bacterium]